MQEDARGCKRTQEDARGRLGRLGRLGNLGRLGKLDNLDKSMRVFAQMWGENVDLGKNALFIRQIFLFLHMAKV